MLVKIYQKNALSETASNSFHFIQAFSNKLRFKDFVNIWIVEDRVQDLDSVSCGIFQIYFYGNLLIQAKIAKQKTKPP